jgi:hypothetical protein
MSFISVVEDLEKETTPLGVLRYPTREAGDVQITWDKSNAEDVSKARKIFNDLKDKGYRAFSGKKLDQTLRAFDPEVDRIAMLPPIVGG